MFFPTKIERVGRRGSSFSSKCLDQNPQETSPPQSQRRQVYRKVKDDKLISYKLNYTFLNEI
jgi:hypothetical protein